MMIVIHQRDWLKHYVMKNVMMLSCMNLRLVKLDEHVEVNVKLVTLLKQEM